MAGPGRLESSHLSPILFQYAAAILYMEKEMWNTNKDENKRIAEIYGVQRHGLSGYAGGVWLVASPLPAGAAATIRE
jgi:hypothetical protein